MADKLIREVTQWLRNTKLPFELVSGAGHKKIFLNGKMIGVISNKNSSNNRDGKNIKRAIERYVETISAP